MNRHRSNDCARLSRLLGAMTLCLGLARLPAAEPAAAPATPAVTNEVKVAEAAGPVALGREFTAYQLVAQRNIFNPNRSRRSSRSGGDSEKPAPRVDVIALSGTMSYTRGTFAFFDSSSSEFKKVLKPGEAIAGYTVKEIAQNHVQLEKESALFELKVGQQLRREEEGAWAVISSASITSSQNSTPTEGSAGASANSGEGPSEALKRLLEQRKKENNP